MDDRIMDDEWKDGVICDLELVDHDERKVLLKGIHFTWSDPQA